MNKACPVVARKNSGQIEILAFKHPSGHNQLVKGTIEQGEDVSAACSRELFEESGVEAKSGEFLGEWDANFEKQIWGFFLMEYSEELSESWEHFTTDGGGHVFRFFWHPLNADLNSDWRPLFKRAVKFVQKALTTAVEDN